MRIIPGEYDCVSRASCNRSRLRQAHQTSCDPAMAYFLIAVMHEKHFPKTAMPIVRLRKPRVDQVRARGWGGVKIKAGVRRGYVSLPITPLPANKSAYPYGYLRIGLVVHEYAHAFEVLKFNKTNHDVRFTMILDALLHETEHIWNPAVALAAESK